MSKVLEKKPFDFDRSPALRLTLVNRDQGLHAQCMGTRANNIRGTDRQFQ